MIRSEPVRTGGHRRTEPAAALALLLILLAFLSAPAPAALPLQSPDSTLIESILFVGNDHTHEEILTREMRLREGDPYDARAAEEDRQRIENLGLFTRVELQLLPGAGGVVLLYILSERWYVFPYPLLFIHDRDWSKFSYGAAVRHDNFRGRAVTVSGNFWLGYNPSASLSYTNPWIHSRHRLALNAQLNYSHVENLSPAVSDFTERHLSAAVSLGKRLGSDTRVSAGLGYREVHLPPELELTRSAGGTDRIGQISAAVNYDSRDYSPWPGRGWYADAGVALKLVAAESDYLFVVGDVRRYQPLPGGGILAGRLRVDWSSGRLPLYNRLYLGYSERVRGHFNEVVEGDGRVVAGAALRWPLLKRRYFNLTDEDEGYLDYFRNLPFALHAELFYDAGLIAGGSWSRAEQRRLGGFGAGLALQLPYVELLRFERAWNLAGRGEYIIDMKVWF